MVPAYKPEAALEIFRRTLSNKDVATGDVSVNDNYTTSGTKTCYHPEKLPKNPVPTCYLLSMGGTCAENQIEAVHNETAKVFDYIITDPPPSNVSCPFSVPAGPERGSLFQDDTPFSDQGPKPQYEIFR